MTKKKPNNKPMPSALSTFKFTRHSNVGFADAAEDSKFLQESFIDNGELAVLEDVTNPISIIVGRTGSGKTALIEKILENQERSVKIYPDQLALVYLSDNLLFKFFNEIGVKLDPFFNFLWKHIFITELIQLYKKGSDKTSKLNFITELITRGKQGRLSKDITDYLETYGENFWLSTEKRVKEEVKKYEKQIAQGMDANLKANIFAAEATAKVQSERNLNVSEEQKIELIDRGREVVSSLQIKTISGIFDLLSEEMNDSKKKYFILIDKLDEDWVNDELRYRIIRSLLEVVRDFNNRMQNSKICVAIREDLIGRVFRNTRDSGFQEEKFEALYAKLIWNESELLNLLDLRIKQISKDKFSKSLSLIDTLPGKIGKQGATSYLIDRTMMRPRDLIWFFNHCIKAAPNKNQFTQDDITRAELQYSESRLSALDYEWSVDYPNLTSLILMLKKYPQIFKEADRILAFHDSCLNFVTKTVEKQDKIYKTIFERLNEGNQEGLFRDLMSILYLVGAIGIKNDHFVGVIWSFNGERKVFSDFDLDTKYYVHPSLWKILGNRPP